MYARTTSKLWPVSIPTIVMLSFLDRASTNLEYLIALCLHMIFAVLPAARRILLSFKNLFKIISFWRFFVVIMPKWQLRIIFCKWRVIFLWIEIIAWLIWVFLLHLILIILFTNPQGDRRGRPRKPYRRLWSYGHIYYQTRSWWPSDVEAIFNGSNGSPRTVVLWSWWFLKYKQNNQNQKNNKNKI